MIRLEAMGDQALLIRTPDEATALHLARFLRAQTEPWLQDVVAAYASLAVFVDRDRIDIRQALPTVERWLADRPDPAGLRSGKRHQIPCCYELQLDLDRIADHTGLSPEQVIALHTSVEYTVYAIGFCPGFPYLGYLPPTLTGVPRLASPRLRVEPGSIGLTGRQTGIYPLARPGGWNLIGRTPLELVNVEDGYFPIAVGDTVRFAAISLAEFKRRHGERLATAPP